MAAAVAFDAAAGRTRAQCAVVSTPPHHDAAGRAVSALAPSAAAGCSAPADGFSLVHRAAGSSFVEHVLSKGNSIDLWQGFLSFVGE